MSRATEIKRTRWWEEYDHFSVADIAQNLNMSRDAARAAIAELGDEVTAVAGHKGNGSHREIYRRKSAASKWLRKPWVSGEFHVRGETPLEWMR